MLAQQLRDLIAGGPLGRLDDASRDIWRALDGGLLSDAEAQSLAEAIHARRTAARSGPQGFSGGPGGASKVQRSWSYFPSKKRPQRSPDRQRSLERRRTLAASGPLPPALACKFTVGELAVLRIVSDEVRSHGFCNLTVPEIAARAGVGQTKARMALKEVARLGLATVEERRVPYGPNLPNVVRIISREWLAWIARAGRGGVGRHNGQKVPSVPKAQPLPQGRVHFREGHGQTRVYERGWTAEGHAMTGGEGQWTTHSKHRRRPGPRE